MTIIIKGLTNFLAQIIGYQVMVGIRGNELFSHTYYYLPI